MSWPPIVPDAYSALSHGDVERTLQLRFSDVLKSDVPFEDFPFNKGSTEVHGLSETAVSKLKTDVLQRVEEILQTTECSWAKIRPFELSDIIGAILRPIMLAWKTGTGLKGPVLKRQRVWASGKMTENSPPTITFSFLSADSSHVVVIADTISQLVSEATKQLLLVMQQDIWRPYLEDKVIYGFIVTGRHWYLYCYDGKQFIRTKHARLLSFVVDTETQKKDCGAFVDVVLKTLGGSL